MTQVKFVSRMTPTSLPLNTFTSFGDLLKHLRKRAGLTQRELSLAVNYSESYITRLESNSRQPDPAAIKALFIDALHLQHEPEATQRLIQLAESASAQTIVDSIAILERSGERTSNLPAPLTNFVGRHREQAEVLRLLGTTRLLTLTGAGGVGKTRLALQVATAMLAHYPDGVWLIELAPVSDAALVPGTTATALGLHPAVQSPMETLIAYLRNRHVLLLLDNCEHLIQACAELIMTLLRACPQLHLLATSRELLSVPGEIVWRVPSLALDEAVRLFEARTLAAIPESALTSRATSTITKICQRLDGIPLAIELAASRTRVYSIDMIAARLDDRFRLLTGGERTAPPRHQTLRALLDWSYSLLLPDEQRLLRYLSAFAGGWTLEAAEAVGAEMDVVTLLPQLVNKSLVIVSDRANQHRFSMLETIRQFGIEKLNKHDEADLVYARMAAYLVTVGQALGRSTDHWLQIEAELDNVRALIGWARLHSDPAASLRLVVTLGFQFTWDYLVEPLAWLADALARGVNAPAKLRQAALIAQLGQMYFSGYHLSGWADRAEEYVTLSEQIEDDVVKIETLFWAGLVAWHRQEYDRVAEWHSRGLELAQLMPHRRDGQGVANFNWGLGLVQMKKGNTEAAATYFQRSLQAGREGNNGSAMFLGLSGYAWMDARVALAHCEKEVARLRTQEPYEPIVRVLQAYTQPLLLLGHYTQAEAVLTECLMLWHQLGVRWDASLGSAQALLDLGQVAWLQNDPATARAWYEQSLDEYSQVGDKERIARLHVYIGLTRLAQGDFETAGKDVQIGLNLYRELEQPAGIALALAAQARLAEVHGQLELAARLFGAASVSQELLAVSILWPASPIIYQREIAEARERFTKTPWTHHWREGECLSHEQAVLEEPK